MNANLFAHIVAVAEQLPDKPFLIEGTMQTTGRARSYDGFSIRFSPQGQVLAIRPGKSGGVLDANEPAPAGSPMEIVWRSKRGVPKKPALLLLNELLFAIDDSGIATCWDAKTGTVVWNERVGGNYSASPVAAGDRIYVCSEEGKITVLAASRTFAKLAENQLEDGFMATPAFSGDSLILRTKSALYRIGR